MSRSPSNDQVVFDELAFEFRQFASHLSASKPEPVHAAHDGILFLLCIVACRVEGTDQFQNLGGMHDGLLEAAWFEKGRSGFSTSQRLDSPGWIWFPKAGSEGDLIFPGEWISSRGPVGG